MPRINRKDSPEEQERHGTAYGRLQQIIFSAEPKAEEFSRALDEALAVGFPVDWAEDDENGYTLLHFAVNMIERIKASLPQLLIDAGADVNVKAGNGETPLGRACTGYIYHGAPEYLTAINSLLSAGARPELDSRWESKDWMNPEQQARRNWLEGYMAAREEARAQDRAEEAAPAFDYAL